MLEREPARQDHDRLVLHPVILERQRLAGVDVEDLADVAVGVRPDQLVAPGLLDPLAAAAVVAHAGQYRTHAAVTIHSTTPASSGWSESRSWVGLPPSSF